MIADKIKNARTIKKFTQEQIAEDLNVAILYLNKENDN